MSLTKCARRRECG